MRCRLMETCHKQKSTLIGTISVHTKTMKIQILQWFLDFIIMHLLVDRLTQVQNYKVLSLKVNLIIDNSVQVVQIQRDHVETLTL